mmetsp:Transcript_145318/g.264072  ORF Transcript_145318/g.264072 Transcript_145318/m.264072 type:complete len:241 (-) Transcript_145318:317-1039(-)
MTIASTPADTKACTRSRSLGRVPTAAATIKLLLSSLVASGKSAFFFRSVRATSAKIRPSLLMTGSFPFFDSLRILLQSCKERPSSAVTSLSMLVMMAPTRMLMRSATKSVSRFVTRPSSLEPMLPSSVTGKPVNPQLPLTTSSSATVIVGLMQMGSMMKPLSNFFTFMTSLHWSSIEMFEWMIPMPPSNAIAMAVRASVTVSIGLDTIGVFSLIFFVKRDHKWTSCTPKLICPGMQMRSS